MKQIILKTSLITLMISGAAFAQEDKKLSMDGEFGFIVTTGNSETSSASAGLNIKQELDKWSNEYVINGLYKKDTVENDDGEDEERVSAQKFFASAQGNYKLENPDNRLFGFASYEDNRLSSYDFQSTLAGGWNQKLWETDKSGFDYSIGPGYSYSKDLNDVTSKGLIVRGSFNYFWNLSENAKFTQAFSTEIGDENTKSRSETAISANLAGGLSMKFSIRLDHNTDVAEGTDKLDTETAVTLVYTFF